MLLFSIKLINLVLKKLKVRIYLDLFMFYMCIFERFSCFPQCSQSCGAHKPRYDRFLEIDRQIDR